MQQLRATIESPTFPALSIILSGTHLIKQLSQLERQWRERKCSIFETAANGDSNPGSLDWESVNLPLSYRSPHLQLFKIKIYILLVVFSRLDVVRNRVYVLVTRSPCLQSGNSICLPAVTLLIRWIFDKAQCHPQVALPRVVSLQVHMPKRPRLL